MLSDDLYWLELLEFFNELFMAELFDEVCFDKSRERTSMTRSVLRLIASRDCCASLIFVAH
ncbi:hypothetical protein M6B38_106595 [Iris pallida]|uniref:Maturase K n=1 Tax=Iris pallida TaxID=29817 RepID=A0AAX6ERV1_IRIPA|nr:hypothetical protein M6B38_202760 [Iris pallida]KAJ6806733.1 hypothetical protein M6B38_106595 [Iris pallida]